MTTSKITLESNQVQGCKIIYLNGDIQKLDISQFNRNKNETHSIIKIENVSFKKEIAIGAFVDALDYISFPDHPPVDNDKKEWDNFFVKTTGNAIPNNID